MVVDVLLGGGVGDDLDGHGGGEGEQEEKELRKSLKFTLFKKSHLRRKEIVNKEILTR